MGPNTACCDGDLPATAAAAAARGVLFPGWDVYRI